MYNIEPDRTTTHLITAKPTEYSSPEHANTTFLLLVEVEQQNNYDNSTLIEAKMKVHYQLLDTASIAPAKHNRHSFVAHYRRSYDGLGGDIRITGSFGGAFLTVDPDYLRGRRIGTYLLNEIIRWAHQWPTADVYVIQLLEGQAHDSFTQNKERRNKYYERFGIEFDYDDTETKRSGTSKPMKASQLKVVGSWTKNIERHELAPHLVTIHGQLAELTRELKFRKEQAEGARMANMLVIPTASPTPRRSSLITALIWLCIGASVALLYARYMNV